MTGSEDKIIDALSEHQERSTEHYVSVFSPFIYATFVAFEAVDPDLSHIRLPDGTDIHGVPRHGGVTGLAPGVQVMCANPGPDKPLLIAFVPLGDITLYEAP